MFPLITTVFVCSSCSSGGNERKYETMTYYGAWKARADETKSKVATIETGQSAYLRYEFDSLDRNVLDSPYPYWDKVHVYLDKKGIRKAKLYANPAKSFLTEEFYFDNGNLIYAQIDSQGIRETEPDSIFRGDRYFFTKNVLVLALDSSGKRKDITDDTVKIKSVDLIFESDQIKKIIADKQIKL